MGATAGVLPGLPWHYARRPNDLGLCRGWVRAAHPPVGHQPLVGRHYRVDEEVPVGEPVLAGFDVTGCCDGMQCFKMDKFSPFQLRSSK
jgi:hypothetical protein